MKIYRKVLLLISLSAAVLLAAGCSSGRNEGVYDYGEPSFAESEAPARLMKSEAAPLTAGDAGMNAAAPAEEADSAAPPTEKKKPGRKRIYNGSIGLIVDKTEDSRRELENMTLLRGGYVESSYSDYMVLRIPAEHFREVFNSILAMGKVRHQEISTWDVTEQFADTTRRLDTALQTRERLYALLERSTDAEERARILREIGRLSEEIESVKQQLSMMENRIAYSRITVSLEPRLTQADDRGSIPFDWIAWLDPLHPVSSRLKARVKINPGETFAVFEKERVYVAEDAEGTTLFLSSIDNNPRGDSLFWQKALSFHLSDYYKSAEPVSIAIGDSEFLGIHFTSKDREPYQYITAVLEDGKTLHILEIFSPDGGADLTPLLKEIEKGEIR
ncbi:MAG: DUF4349 domain-containing protein [Spirochaetales bacterium]|nr:DUF4349 domain-containing protein [Spirochaetales bacterium]